MYVLFSKHLQNTYRIYLVRVVLDEQQVGRSVLGGSSKNTLMCQKFIANCLALLMPQCLIEMESDVCHINTHITLQETQQFPRNNNKSLIR